MAEVAKRYALALSEVGGDPAELEGGLQTVVAALSSSPETMELFLSPRVPVPAKKELVAKAFRGKVADRVVDFVNLLIDKRREEALADIFEQYVLENDKKLSRVRAEVTLSRDLAKETEAAIRETILAKRESFGITDKGDLNLMVQMKVNPDLLGGMIIRIGDYLLDSSVRKFVAQWKQGVLARKMTNETGWSDS